MVLICNNNILSIDKFHKNRCEEKAAIQYIILNEEKYSEKYKEKPIIEHKATKEDMKLYVDCVEHLEIKRTGPITLKKST